MEALERALRSSILHRDRRPRPGRPPAFPARAPALVRVLAPAFLAAAAGCGRPDPSPEPIRPDEDACAECRMQILLQRFSAQVLLPGGDRLKFDDLSCFLGRLRREPSVAGAPAWVGAYDTGRWIDARSAAYVRTEEATPMGSGILAFDGLEEARKRGDPETLDGILKARAGR